MQILRHRLIVASLGMAMTVFAFAPAAFAQDATAPETPAADTPAADTPAPAPTDPEADAAQSGGEAGNPAQQEVMEIVRETFEDWQVRCAPDGSDCFLYQLALDQESNPVAEVSLVKLPASSEAAAGVTVVSPLGTLLTTGVMLQIDDGEQRQYPFAWCSQVGCFSRFGLAQVSIDAMKRGRSASLALVSVNQPEAPVSLAVSLRGFTAAFDSLETPPSPAGAAPVNRTAPSAAREPLPDLLPRN